MGEGLGGGSGALDFLPPAAVLGGGGGVEPGAGAPFHAVVGWRVGRPALAARGGRRGAAAHGGREDRLDPSRDTGELPADLTAAAPAATRAHRFLLDRGLLQNRQTHIIKNTHSM